MYLRMIDNDNTKALFSISSFIVSVADVKNDDGQYYKPEVDADELSSEFGISKGDINDLLESLVLKKEEKETLVMLSRELHAGNEDFEKLDTEEIIGTLIGAGIAMFLQSAKTTNKVILDNQEIRVSLLKQCVDEFIELSKEEFADHQTSIDYESIEVKKVIIFELLGIACSDGEISNNELEIIKHICELLDVDHFFIEDSIEIIQQLTELHRKGLQLINE